MSQCCQFMFQGLQFAAFITIYDAAKLQLFEKDNVKSKYTSHFCILHHRAQRITITLYLCGKRLITVLLLSLYLLLSSSLSPSLSLSLSLSLYLSISLPLSLSLPPSLFISLPLSHSSYSTLTPSLSSHGVGHQADSSSGKPLNSQLLLQPRLLEALPLEQQQLPLLQYLPSMLQSHLGSQWVASRLRVQPLQVAMQN